MIKKNLQMFHVKDMPEYVKYQWKHEIPRLNVFIKQTHFCQIIDDVTGTTLVSLQVLN